MGNKKKNKNTKQIIVVSKNDKSGKKKKKVVHSGVDGLRGITQNVAVSVGTPFGDNPKTATIQAGLDAFNACSVPLPRAIGDYTVIRTTQVVSGTQVVSLFGPVAYSATAVYATEANYSGPMWSNVCRIASVASNAPMNNSNNVMANAFTAMNETSWDHARMVPAACSVQIMNPEALQTTHGIVYAGRSRQMLNFVNNTKTWDAFANELVSYSNPRLMSAGKLALKGVQADCVPYDMNAMSDFRYRHTATDGGQFTANVQGVKFDAFAPLFVYNPEGIDLQYLVCTEWRVRFDPSNPAYASSTYHPSSSLGYWDRLQHYASSIGNGVVDIADRLSPHAAQAMPYLMEYGAARYGARGVRALGI